MLYIQGASHLTPTEFFNHEFACNDEIGLLPEKIMFEDMKDRVWLNTSICIYNLLIMIFRDFSHFGQQESNAFDNAELFLFNSKHKPWTERYRPIFDSLPPKAKQFVIDWRKGKVFHRYYRLKHSNSIAANLVLWQRLTKSAMGIKVCSQTLTKSLTSRQCRWSLTTPRWQFQKEVQGWWRINGDIGECDATESWGQFETFEFSRAWLCS